MDSITNVTRQQPQVTPSQTNGHVAKEATKTPHTKEPKEPDIIEELQQNGKVSNHKNHKIESEQEVQNLVKHLNHALEPMNTNLEFGVDAQDVFYVSVIDSQTNKMIRRFPAEEAQSFLPKIQELTGILFDTKG